MQGKIPFLRKMAYGSGGAAECIMANLVLVLALPIFNLGLGIDAKLIGLALLIQKFWDAITDPVMGNISDNSRLRWGRRKPFILIGAILTGIFCMVMWMPPAGLSDNSLIIFFILVTVFYYTSYTVFFVPFNALGFEMTSDYDERTKLMGYKTMFMNFANMAFLPFAYDLCFTLGDGDEIVGVRYVGIIFGLIIMAFGILPALFGKERTMDHQQEKTPFIKAIKTTVTNKPFMILCGIIFTMLSAAIIGGPLMNYINNAYTLNNEAARLEYVQKLPVLLEKADDEFVSLKESNATLTYAEFAKEQAPEMAFADFAQERGEEYGVFLGYIKIKAAKFMKYGMWIYGFMGLISVPVISALGVRFGKRRILMAGIILAGIAYGGSWFYITPKLPWLHLIYGALASPALSCVWVFTYAMAADVCDVDELETGKRREGSFGAVFSLVMKTSAAIVVSISALVVDWVQFDTTTAFQSAETILRMRRFFAFAPLIFLSIAFILTLKFPITRQKMEEVQAQLAERKAAQSA